MLGGIDNEDNMAALQKLIDQAEKLVVLVDSSKFDGRGSLILCPLSRIDIVVTDDGIGDTAAALLRDAVDVAMGAQDFARAGALLATLEEIGQAGLADRNLAGIAATVRQVAPDVIVNAAAHTAVDKAEGEPARARLLNATVAAYARSLQLTENQYQAGIVAYLNVLSAQTTVLGAQNSLNSVKNRRLTAVNTLLKNVAGRWEPLDAGLRKE